MEVYSVFCLFFLCKFVGDFFFFWGGGLRLVCNFFFCFLEIINIWEQNLLVQSFVVGRMMVDGDMEIDVGFVGVDFFIGGNVLLMLIIIGNERVVNIDL